MARTLVFTRTKRGADRVAKHLDSASISAAAIHGNKSQRQREEALKAFRDGKTRVLVATDIAARGIDVDAVSHVINFELPDVPEAYVHRIGRTARAGAEGSAISLCDAEERDLLKAIERLTRQSIPSENRRGDASIAADQAIAERPSQGRGGRGGGQSNGGGRGGRDGARSGGGRSGGAAGEARSQQRSPRGTGQQADRPAASRSQGDRVGTPRPAMSERAYAERSPEREQVEWSSRPKPAPRPASGERAGGSGRGERPGGRGASGERGYGDRNASRGDQAERSSRPQAQRGAGGERSVAERAKLADSNGGWRPDTGASRPAQEKQNAGNRKKYKPARQWSAGPASTA